METRVDNTVRSFLSLIDRKYTSSRTHFRPMDFGRRGMMYTLDVATSVTFGTPWGFLEGDSDVNDYIKMSEQMLPTFGVLGSLPWLVYVMHAWPLNLLMPGAGDKVGFGCLMKWVYFLIYFIFLLFPHGLILPFLDRGPEILMRQVKC